MTPLRIAVVGCGRMGQIRARSVQRAGARVVLLCDPDKRRAAELAADCGAPTIAAGSDDLAWDGIDAVFCCTPPHLRGPLERSALEAGRHIFAEKPVGLDASQCQSLATLAAERGLVAAVGYMNRSRDWMPDLRRRLIDQPVLGVSATWIGRRYKVPWWGLPAESGGPINEQATHLVDLCRFLVGEIAGVQATGLDAGASPDGVESVAVSLRFERGAVGSLLYSCAANEKLVDFCIYTADDRVHLQGWDFHPAERSPAELPDENAVFDVEVRDFLQAIRRGEPQGVRSTFADALRTQRAVDAIRRSLATGLAESP